MSAPEFSRPVRLKAIPEEPLVLEADAAERQALAERFGIVAIESLRAEIALEPEKKGKVSAHGSLDAQIVQACAVSGDEFPVAIEEDLGFVFVPAQQRAPTEQEDEEIEIEIELAGEELDEIEYEGDSFDLGEAVAQSLALAIDPYAEGPGADEARKRAGIVADDAKPSGPLAAALSALKKN